MSAKTDVPGDNMHLKARTIILSLGLPVLIGVILSIRSQLELPASTGPYATGRTRIQWVDTSRPEVLTADPGDVREVPALVWYPAEAGSGVDAGYFPNLAAVSDALVESGEVAWWQVAGLRFVRAQSRLDPQPVKDQGTFPVVFLSPGNGTNIEFYSGLAAELASHGYIVMGINHPYDVPAVELSTGGIARYDKAQWTLSVEAHQAYSAERIKVRTADLLYALDQLDEMNAGGPFAGIIDLNAVAVAGHSLGGIAASEACKADERFKACLNFDGIQRGGPFSADEAAVPPHQPFLFLTKEARLPPETVERFESMPESYWVVVHEASHQSFTDGPLLQPSFLPGPDQADRQMSLIQGYSLAFLDMTLKGRAHGLLSMPVEQPDISIRVFPSN
jgi:hypothetical protein